MQHTVGREDRFIRGGLALSLLLMSLFGATAAQGPVIGALLFALLGIYIAATAVLGWDPLYTRFGMDTRESHSDQASAPSNLRVATGAPEGSDPDGDPGAAAQIDLRDQAVAQERSTGE